MSSTQRLTARGIGIMAAMLAVAAMLGAQREADAGQHLYAGTFDLPSLTPVVSLSTQGLSLSLEDTHAAIRRAEVLIEYSARFNIPTELAGAIYDIAVEEGIDPEVGFRLVNVESSFDPKALSYAGAVGLTQLLPTTARIFEPLVTDQQLYSRDLNLRIGFRYLGELLEAFDGDLALALTAYNRGPSRIRQLMARGREPWNGYARSVLDGYQPSIPPK